MSNLKQAETIISILEKHSANGADDESLIIKKMDYYKIVAAFQGAMDCSPHEPTWELSEDQLYAIRSGGDILRTEEVMKLLNISSKTTFREWIANKGFPEGTPLKNGGSGRPLGWRLNEVLEWMKSQNCDKLEFEEE